MAPNSHSTSKGACTLQQHRGNANMKNNEKNGDECKIMAYTGKHVVKSKPMLTLGVMHPQL